MRAIFFAILATLLAGCATTPDPIDHLVADYTATRGMWMNGIYPRLDLPQTASQELVIRKALEMDSFGGDQLTGGKILKVRQIHIPPPIPEIEPALFAALVQTKAGEKIVLFKFEDYDWWSRVLNLNIK
jgi:hypothetical protein